MAFHHPTFVTTLDAIHYGRIAQIMDKPTAHGTHMVPLVARAWPANRVLLQPHIRHLPSRICPNLSFRGNIPIQRPHRPVRLSHLFILYRAHASHLEPSTGI